MVERSPEFYERLVRAAQALTILVDREGVITCVTDHSFELGGYLPEELVGLNIVDFIHPDDLEDIMEAFAGVLDQPDGASQRWPPLLLRLRLPDGTYAPIEASGHGLFDDPVLGGAVYSVRRVDETTAIYQILEQMVQGTDHTEILRSLVSMAGAPPPAMRATLGYDLVDGVATSFLASDDDYPVIELMSMAVPGLPWQSPSPTDNDPQAIRVDDLPEPMRKFAAERGFFEIWWVPVTLPDRGVVAVFVNWTLEQTLPGASVKQRMRRARDVAGLVFSRRQYQEKLIARERLASLGELAGAIAHEIKNPLNFIKNFSEDTNEIVTELRDAITKELSGRLPDEIAELCDFLTSSSQSVVSNSGRIENIVTGILTQSRDPSAEMVSTDLNSLVTDAATLGYKGWRANQEGAITVLEEDYDTALPPIPVVYADVLRVVINLVTNACQAAEQRAKTSTDEFTPTVRVATAARTGKAVITVSDNGIGIPEDIRDRILEPFFTTKPAGEGTGLGLSIVHDVVTQHSGTLDIASTMGESTEITISFPLTQ